MQKKRPNGFPQIVSGWMAMIFGALLMLIGITTKVTDFLDRIDPSLLWKRYILIFSGGALLALSITLICVGWIIRAIYFIPGHASVDLSEKPQG